MKISILTLFPEMFVGPFNHSIIKRAKEKKIITIDFVNIRDFGIGKHKIVDDKPYGGGVGMLLRVDVVAQALVSARCKNQDSCREKVILLEASGNQFNQKRAHALTTYNHLIFVCGHYEGIDERIKTLVDEEISIGDYVLTGGEIPTMVITDCIVRLLPSVLGKDESSHHESFEEITIDNKKTRILEYPQYTRPEKYDNLPVPDILLSGDHEKIAQWKTQESLKHTKKKRPDLLEK